MTKQTWHSLLGVAAALVIQSGGHAHAASDADAGTRVARVVIYPDRAQVTREQAVRCGDRVQVRFTGLPPAADAASLRAQISVGHVDGLRSEDKVRSEAFNKKVEELDEKIHQIERQLATLRDQRARQDEQSRIASQYDELTTTPSVQRVAINSVFRKSVAKLMLGLLSTSLKLSTVGWAGACRSRPARHGCG